MTSRVNCDFCFRLPLGSVPDSGMTSDNFTNSYFESLGDRNMGDGMSGSDSQLDEFEPYKGGAAQVNLHLKS